MPGTSFSVDLLVVTPDQLRKITIQLSKGFKPDGAVEWLMNFGLDERKKTIEQFQPVIKLGVKINPAHHAKADETAKRGFDDAQTSAAFAAADSAKLAAEGAISKQTAQADARRIIAARGAETPTALPGAKRSTATRDTKRPVGVRRAKTRTRKR